MTTKLSELQERRAYELRLTPDRALETVLGRRVRVTEVRCVANGDPFDEFEIHVEEQS